MRFDILPIQHVACFAQIFTLQMWVNFQDSRPFALLHQAISSL